MPTINRAQETKLGLLCEKLIEAGLLVVLVVVPLFFNIHSNRIYEPDKIVFLRSVAILMATFGLIRAFEQRRSRTSCLDCRSGLLTLLSTLKGQPVLQSALLVAAVYVLSSLTSIMPRTSIGGSYERLQGAYTTLSYIILFFCSILVIRRRPQINRLITTCIMVSVPISLYALVQHAGWDPLPWTSDVEHRANSTLGNPIFLGAYVVMIAPLTWFRLVESISALRREEIEHSQLKLRGLLSRTSHQLSAATADMALPAAPTPSLSLLASSGYASLRFFGLLDVSQRIHLRGPQSQASHSEPSRLFRSKAGEKSGLYLLIAVLQALALHWSGSRGPQLSFLVGGVVFLLLLGIVTHRQWLTWTAGGSAVLGAIFLVLLNISGAPDFIRPLPGISRLTNLVETGRGTGKVRVLIWQGAIDLFLPHQPIKRPDGTEDPMNAIRPLIGYGSETMKVTFNRFYPPGLAYVESRNATPDRCHNETFDTLVTTGVIGFLASQLIFASLLFWGLKRMGLVRDKRCRNFFVLSWGGGGLLGAALLFTVKREFIGIGFPGGVVCGVIFFIALSAHNAHKKDRSFMTNRYQLLLAALLAALIAHFVEIHLGIATGVIRTLFWVYAALLVVVCREEEESDSQGPNVVPAKQPGIAGMECPTQSPNPAPSDSRSMERPQSVYTLLIGLILAVLVYGFVINKSFESSISSIILHSVTIGTDNTALSSTCGIVSALFLVWLICGTVAFSESSGPKFSAGRSKARSPKPFVYFFLIPPLLAVLYAGIHANVLRQHLFRENNTLIERAGLAANVFPVFCLVVLLTLLGLGLALYRREICERPQWILRGFSSFLGFGILAPVVFFICSTNIKPILADMIFKQGTIVERSKMWPRTISLYERVIELAPREDYYRLTLGRAYLEWAKNPATQPEHRSALFERSYLALEKALTLAPLDPDHSGNIARFYGRRADLAGNAEEHSFFIDQSLKHYKQAAGLSPNDVEIINEWARALLAAGRTDEGLAKYRESLGLDSEFHETYFGIGDLHRHAGQLEEAAEMYEKGLALRPDVAPVWSCLSVIYARLGNHGDAIRAAMRVMEVDPDNFDALKNLGLLYRDPRQLRQAILQAETIARTEPNSAPVYQILGKLYQINGALSRSRTAYARALELNPDDVNCLWGMAEVLREQGRVEEAFPWLLNARKIASSNLDVARGFGEVCISTGRWEQAIEAYETLVTSRPSQIDDRRGLTRAYMEAGEPKEAVAQILVILDIFPDDFSSHMDLVTLYQRLGLSESALAAAEKALESAPDAQQKTLSELVTELRGEGKPDGQHPSALSP